MFCGLKGDLRRRELPPAFNFPQHMPDLIAVAVPHKLRFPIAARKPQRVLKAKQKAQAFLRTGTGQLVPELLGGNLTPIVLVQPRLQNVVLIHHRSSFVRR